MADAIAELERLLPSRRIGGYSETVSDPPRRVSTLHHNTRRVGIEIKFAGLSPEGAAETVAASTNGISRRAAEDCYLVEGGLIECIELRVDPPSTRDRDRDVAYLQAVLRSATSLIVPVIELVTEPVPYRRLQQFSLAVEALRRAGARNAAAYGFSPFSTHLNIEIASQEVDWLTRVAKAYAMSEMWLRRELLPNRSRATADTTSWPTAYVESLLDCDSPSLESLIDDYLAFNPTAYRDLDLMPLFAFLASERVAAANLETAILPRQAFHFRLPDTRIAEDGWSPIVPWNLWVRVEELAEDDERLARLVALWREHHASGRAEDEWIETFSREALQ